MLIPHRLQLEEGAFNARYDRFIAEVLLNGETIPVHCVNPGRMEGLIRPGCRVWVSKAPNQQKRKLAYTLELMEIDGVCLGVNTQEPNRLVAQALQMKLLDGLRRYRSIDTEVAYGDNSRIDLLLHQGDRKHYLEVKNCHLVYPDKIGYFPDSVSKRASHHLLELSRCVSEGDRASVIFVVQRDDAKAVRPSDLHDPEFARSARLAAGAGVRFRAIAFKTSLSGFEFLGEIPVLLGEYSSETLLEFRAKLEPTSGWKRGYYKRAK